ncbi:MAG: Hpt domain-containing protein [Candidatus Competibacteraceae bacterium]|nr:Hpt domain-containing protein [Candidatus Competibacteraceae bacterium]
MTNDDFKQLPLIDHEVLAELQDIMEDGFADLVNHFLDDLPVQLEQLRRAAQENAAKDIFLTAHKLKASCGNLGAIRLGEWVRQLEQAGRQNVLSSVTEMLEETQAVAKQTMTLLQAQLD